MKAVEKGRLVAQSGTADASSAKGQGDKPGGRGEGEGEQPGQPSGQGEGQGQMANAEGRAASPANAGKVHSPRQADSRSGQRGGSNRDGGSDEGGWFFDAGTEVADASPITGSNFDNWSDRLRNGRDADASRAAQRSGQSPGPSPRSACRCPAQRCGATGRASADARSRIRWSSCGTKSPKNSRARRREPARSRGTVIPCLSSIGELVQKYYEQLGAGK